MSMTKHHNLIATCLCETVSILSQRNTRLLDVIERSSLSKHFLFLSKLKIAFILSPSEFLFVLLSILFH